MGSLQKDQINEIGAEEEGFLKGMSMPCPMTLSMILKAACELELFDLIAKSDGSDSQLSAAEITSLLPTKNPQAPAMIDRMLRLLASASFLNCKVVTDDEGNFSKRLYSLAPRSEFLTKNEEGISLAPLALLTWDKVFLDSWCQLKDAILDGGIPFNKAHGMNAFEYPAKDGRFNEVFNQAMFSHTSLAMKRLVEVYHGFEGVTELVDVGGGFGATAAALVAKYPNLRAINFDLPHVIQNATPKKGVEFVAGDMFESIPTAEVILMKWILHDWSDDHSINILKNCHKALPESGKLIVVDKILPEYPEDDLVSTVGFYSDVTMMVVNPGGKERTRREWEVVAKAAGFASIKPICRAYSEWVIEFYKK